MAAEIPIPKQTPHRLDAIDLLRGVAMVVMAIDHSRDFFSNAHFYFDPLDLAVTTPAFFVTRWITNFCAPVFIFLSGASAYLSEHRGKPRSQIQWTLLTRGLWLIFLEFTIIRFGWYFNLDYHYWKLGVIWAIGWCMITLAGLLYLPRWLITIIGCLIVAGHNLLDGIRPESLGHLGWLWHILHVPGEFQPYPWITVRVVYPLIPWVGLIAAGYGFGPVLFWEEFRRRRTILVLGAGLTLAFIILRAPNIYGDAHRWMVQPTWLYTLFSFIDCTKYPPSLLYLLITLGPALMVLAWLDRPLGVVTSRLVVFGRVPFFFYVLHLPLLHGMAVLAALWRYGEARFLFANPPYQLWPIDYTYDLPATYLAWAAAVLLLYPACRWFADLKARRKDWWLSYI